MRLLLISNSTNAGEGYLEYPKASIADFLAKDGIDKVLFIPYAAVTFSYDTYLEKVAARFAEFGVKVDSVHIHNNPVLSVEEAKVIVIGGGNTFQLLTQMQKNGIMDIIREKVSSGIPYIGWSAGANVACPTISTTNDMPIVEPETFNALDLVPFQINPHYLDAHPDGHAGETRQMRIEEYIEVNNNMNVVGLREGSILRLEDQELSLIGEKTLRLFRYGDKHTELSSEDDLSFLMQR